jgi:hypothetical protein
MNSLLNKLNELRDELMAEESDTPNVMNLLDDCINILQTPPPQTPMVGKALTEDILMDFALYSRQWQPHSSGEMWFRGDQWPPREEDVREGDSLASEYLRDRVGSTLPTPVFKAPIGSWRR